MHGEQTDLGRPKAGHHEPQQLLELDQELAVDARPRGGRPRLFRGRLFAAVAVDHHRHRRRPFSVVVVVRLAGRPPAAADVRLAGAAAAAAAHLQHDRIADLAAVQQNGGREHAFADVFAPDDAAVQVFGYDGGHGAPVLFLYPNERVGMRGELARDARVLLYQESPYAGVYGVTRRLKTFVRKGSRAYESATVVRRAEIRVRDNWRNRSTKSDSR